MSIIDLIMLKKQNILQVRNVYTANAFAVGGQFFIGAGSETEPEVKLYELAGGGEELLEGCPGGMMSFLPIPGKGGSFVTIMGLFPPFIGQEAGLYLHVKTGNKWETFKIAELPFAHRCEFVEHGGGYYLVAATVSKYKENPGDWSRPGEVYILTPGEDPAQPWGKLRIDSGITRNHGMTRTRIEGKETICISGAEGIFSIIPGDQQRWSVRRVFEREVSEMTFIDLDGDGHQELVTIEPFHGNTLNIYKKEAKGWELRFSDSLSFGHGLSSGKFNGIPVVVAGNRSGSLALEAFTVSDLAKGIVKRVVIEPNAGPTQTQVFSHASRDYILSANQRKNEVAIYSGSLD